MGSYYGIQRSSEYLAHYGVKGMKWGVRRYVDSNARPNARFNKKYSGNVKPLAMQRDYNNFDKSYARIRAREEAKRIELNDLLIAREHNNKKVNKLAKDPTKVRQMNRAVKRGKRIDAALGKVIPIGRKYTTQTANIGSIQTDIINKAKKSGYTVKTKDKLYMPYAIVRGRGIGVIPVGGTKVKIRNNRRRS